MRERPRDDTTESAAGSRREREKPGYYDDDATGYEVYEPTEEDEDEEGEQSGAAKTDKEKPAMPPAKDS
ncbi:MAG TPA: hypothetical protein VM934_03940 [Pyrinomonadaceae bacterium]|nr:hypothetical protein [Pyrinomonadaceae bacterium]